MSAGRGAKDLVVVTADQDIEFALRGLLARHAELGVKRFDVDLRRHPYRDPGCYGDSHNFLRPFLRSHRHALVVFDLEGCGHESTGRTAVEAHVEGFLSRNGWHNRAAAVAIVPELEAWAWARPEKLAQIIGWSAATIDLLAWLRHTNYLKQNQIKPDRPKEALAAVLRHVRRPRSSRLFEDLAQLAPLAPCHDDAFGKLVAVLRGWFPLPGRP